MKTATAHLLAQLGQTALELRRTTIELARAHLAIAAKEVERAEVERAEREAPASSVDALAEPHALSSAERIVLLQRRVDALYVGAVGAGRGVGGSR